MATSSRQGSTTRRPSQPKVSVCVVTYNHERYIADCLRSILDQEVDFTFELIIADDCSTDRTSLIVDEIASGDRRVRVLRPPSNLGVTQNLMALHNAARGEYVAHLDGDDLALPGKLARQVALMEGQPILAACGHRMVFADEAGAPNGASYPRKLGGRVDLRQAIRYGMPFLASSLMYRRTARTLRWIDHEIFDWFFLTNILRAGDAGYIDEALGRYTVQSQSITAQMKRRAMRERMLSLYQIRLDELPWLKSDFFCHAVAVALSCLKQADPISPTHARLLWESATPEAMRDLPDTIAWHIGNARALTR